MQDSLLQQYSEKFANTLNFEPSIADCNLAMISSSKSPASTNCCRFLFSREKGNEPKRKSLFNFSAILLDTEKAIRIISSFNLWMVAEH